MVKGIRDLIALPDPLGKVQMKRELDTDLLLIRESCPIGVIGVIFESRPDAMVQISTLCIKSGNCAILKGGSEAMNTNKIVFDTIYNAAIEAGLPENSNNIVTPNPLNRLIIIAYTDFNAAWKYTEKYTFTIAKNIERKYILIAGIPSLTTISDGFTNR